MVRLSEGGTHDQSNLIALCKSCHSQIHAKRGDRWHDRQEVYNIHPKIKNKIRRISQNQVEKVVVLYKDRLLRFGFELIEYIASLYNCEIEIIDNTEKSEQQELVEDLVQIITVFSCKLQGKRANKAKKLIRELIQEETDGKSHKSNVDTK